MGWNTGVEPASILGHSQVPHRLGYPTMVGLGRFELTTVHALIVVSLPLEYRPMCPRLLTNVVDPGEPLRTAKRASSRNRTRPQSFEGFGSQSSAQGEMVSTEGFEPSTTCF